MGNYLYNIKYQIGFRFKEQDYIKFIYPYKFVFYMTQIYIDLNIFYLLFTYVPP